MLNVRCEKVNVHSTELEGRIRKLDCCLWKVECRKRKLECCINQSWMLNAKTLNRECKLTNTKCRIDCAKHNVKWNIEFWREWNAIDLEPLATRKAYRKRKPWNVNGLYIWKFNYLKDIGHFGVAWGTGASFKFKLIDKLTPPYKRSCWDWSFDQVWCSKVEQGSSYDSWNMVKEPYKPL